MEMTLETLQSLALPAAATAAAGHILMLCLVQLRRMIFPKVRHRFAASDPPQNVFLPAAGRYVISVVIPPLTFLAGTSHFSASFTLRNRDTGAPSIYRSYGRALFQVKRSDMRGRRTIPLGSFTCEAPGLFEIVCLNPEVVRESYELEISPHVSPIRLIGLILTTIAASTALIGGLVLSVLRISGTL